MSAGINLRPINAGLAPATCSATFLPSYFSLARLALHWMPTQAQRQRGWAPVLPGGSVQACTDTPVLAANVGDAVEEAEDDAWLCWKSCSMAV